MEITPLFKGKNNAYKLEISKQTAKELEITAYVKRIIQEIPRANVNFTNKKSVKRELE